MKRLRFLVPLASLIALLAAAAPAQAKFTVCNKTDYPVSVALGRFQGKEWTSEGWWRVEAKGCEELVPGVLKGRYYYLRAVHMGVDGGWDGNRFFCVSAENFTIKGRENCSKRGYVQAGFFEVDTENFPSWVQNLSD